MNNRLLISILIVATMLLGLSCTKTIKFNYEKHKSLLVVNSLIMPDSTIMAKVSYSLLFAYDEYSTNTYIDNATVKLFINGKYIGDMQYVEHDRYEGTYKIDYKPKEGDKIMIKASAEGFDPVSAETYLPYKSKIIEVTKTIVAETTEYSSNSSKLNIRLKFKDEADEKNYYKISCYICNWILSYNEITGKYIKSRRLNKLDLFSTDILIQSGSDNIFEKSENNIVSVFADDLINGKEYTIDMNTSLVLFDDSEQKDTLIFSLDAISYDYYMYTQTVNAQSSADDIIAEPFMIYSNVQNGIGIVGCSTPNITVYPLD